MKTAQQIEITDAREWNGDARLYKLSVPMVAYSWLDQRTIECEYVVVSAANVPFSGPETYIFGCDANGNVSDWSELEGSFRGGHDHNAALEAAGYDVKS